MQAFFFQIFLSKKAVQVSPIEIKAETLLSCLYRKATLNYIIQAFAHYPNAPFRYD